MSLIGKTVRIYVSGGYNGITSCVVEGIILDKYLGVIDRTSEMPSGLGGSINLRMSQNIDFYIIQTSENILHAECRHLRSIVTEKQVFEKD